MTELNGQVQISQCGKTVWVHSTEGETVGRFSMVFGMDAHTTVVQQMAGSSQCLHCTHEKPTKAVWLEFCELMQRHHGIAVDLRMMFH